MKDLIFVCLSDIHVSTRNSTSILEKLNKVVARAQAIKTKYSKGRLIFIVPGDIAFSRKIEEYALLDCVFNSLNSVGEVIISPGNHDHDFSFYKDDLRENMISTYREKDINESVIELATKGQSEFFRFKDRVSRKEDINKSNIYLEHHYEEIRISCLNTAWCSSLRESSGDLYYPERFIDKDRKSVV